MDRLFFSDRRVSTVEKPGKSPFSFSLSLSLSLSVFRLSLSYFVFLFLPLFPFLSFLIPLNSHVLHVCSSLISFPFFFSFSSLSFSFPFLISPLFLFDPHPSTKFVKKWGKLLPTFLHATCHHLVFLPYFIFPSYNIM